MALTPFRWIAAVIIGMLVVTMAIMTDPREFWETERYRLTPSEVEGMNLRMAAEGTRLRAAGLANQYRMAQLADSLRPVVARGEPRAIRVSYAANVAETVRIALDSVVLKATERVGPTLKMGTDVVAITDTFAIRGYPFMGSSRVRPFYILPRDASQRCVAVLRVGRLGQWDRTSIMRAINTEDAQPQVLGPCAYYAAFGVPGDRVREWLQRRGTMLALGGSWTRVAEQPRLGSEPDAYFKTDPFYGIGHAALEYMSLRGVRCAVGELAPCEAGVLEANLRARQLALGPAISPLIGLGPLSYRQGGDFGGREAEMLAGMVRSLGRERFAAFWTSNEPLPVAFEKASGVSLGAWVSEWVNERMDPLKRGPKAPAVTLLWAALVVIGCVLAGTLAAMRRQYS